MEGELQDQGQLDQDLEEWLSPIRIQFFHVFFSEEEKQESIWMEHSSPERAIISNQAPEGERPTMLVIKWLEKVEGSVDNIDSSLCVGLYMEEDNSLVTWSGTDPDTNMNSFNWSKEDNDWIFPGDQYKEELKKWRGPIHNGQLHSQTLKKKRKTEDTCSKYASSAKFNGIFREGKPKIPIKSYKDKCAPAMLY